MQVYADHEFCHNFKLEGKNTANISIKCFYIQYVRSFMTLISDEQEPALSQPLHLPGHALRTGTPDKMSLTVLELV